MKEKLNNYQKLKMTERKNDKAKGKDKKQTPTFSEKDIDEFRKKNGLPRLTKNKTKNKFKVKKNKKFKNEILKLFEENDDYGETDEIPASFETAHLKRKNVKLAKDHPVINKVKDNIAHDSKKINSNSIEEHSIKKINKKKKKEDKISLLNGNNDSNKMTVNEIIQIKKANKKEFHQIKSKLLNQSMEVDDSCKINKLQQRMMERFKEIKTGQDKKQYLKKKKEMKRLNKKQNLPKTKKMMEQNKQDYLQENKEVHKEELTNSMEKQFLQEIKVLEKKVMLPAKKDILLGIKKSSKKEKLKKLLQKAVSVKTNGDSGNKLRDRMMERLKAAQFRFLNEKLYTSTGREAQQLFVSDPGAFTTYHQGYRLQTSKWPLNPLDLVVKMILKMPKTHIIADMGCGEANLSTRVPHTVHSLDLVACKPHVTACDMAHTPLNTQSVDVAVYCLALMGTQITAYLAEGNRVLKIGGRLIIAEVESRFDDVNAFTKDVERLGFKLKKLDQQHQVFFFLEFDKTRDLPAKINKLPEIKLKPCLYKRR